MDQRTELSNRLQDRPKIYFPQMVRWLEDLTTALVGALLTQYPTLPALQKAKPAQLEVFLRCHGLRDPEKRQLLLAEIRTAVVATTDEAIVGAALHIAPVTQSSGNSTWVQFRWACPKFLRHDNLSELKSRAVRCRESEVSPRLRLYCTEDITNPATLIFVTPPGLPARYRRP